MRKLGLPMFYLDAYVDKHGKGSIYEGIDAPVDDDIIVEHLKEFTDLLLTEQILTSMESFMSIIVLSSKRL